MYQLIYLQMYNIILPILIFIMHFYYIKPGHMKVWDKSVRGDLTNLA